MSVFLDMYRQYQRSTWPSVVRYVVRAELHGNARGHHPPVLVGVTRALGAQQHIEHAPLREAAARPARAGEIWNKG